MIALLAFFAFPLNASASSKLIEITSKGPIQTSPTEVVSISFRVQNPDTTYVQFNINFELPNGWSTISGGGLIDLPAKGNAMRIASFKIPPDAVSGDFKVRALLESSTSGKLLDTSEIQISVLPAPKIELYLNGTAKAQILAGEKFNLEFNIQNTGNVPLLVDFSLKAIDPGKAKILSPSLLLGLDEKGVVPVEVEVPDTIDRVEDVIIILAAKASQVFNGEIAVEKSFSYRFTVYPKSSGKVDEYIRLPGKVAVRVLVEDRNEVRSSGQVEVSLKGALNEQKTDEIDLLYRGPNPGRNMIFFTKEENAHLAYKTKNFGLFLGDGYFDLSPLVDISRSGRGAELDATFSDFGIGTFFSRSSKGQSTEDAFGLDLNYMFDEENKLSFNFLETAVGGRRTSFLDDRKVYGVRGQFGDPDESNLDIEYSWGGFDGRIDSDNALRVDARLHKEDLDFRFKHVDAGNDFPGYYRDQTSNEIAGSIPLGEDFNINGNWRQQRRNFGEGENSSIIDDRFFRIGAGYNSPNAGSISFDYIDQTRRDIFENPRFDNTERFWRVGANLMLNDLTLGGRLELGDNEDRIRKATVMHLSQLGMFSWRVNENLFISGFGEYKRGDFFNIDRRNSIRTGMTLRYNPTKSTFLSSGFNCEVERHSLRRWNFPFTFRYTFADGDELEIRARHSIRSKGTYRDDDTAVMVEYSIPLSIPLDRRDDIGTLSGVVRDLENNGAGIKDILVRTENKAALTDENGSYTIKGLGIGRHYVTVESQNLGVNRITIPRTPTYVDIPAGTIKLDFDVVTASNINGRVFIPSNKEDIADKGLMDILVELTYEDCVERILTDESGRFTFENLKPGTYKITMDNTRIPAHYHLEKDKYEFELKPGETLEMNIQVVEDLVKVQIIQSGELSTE